MKFFKALNGKVPFRGWYHGLKDKKVRSRITERLNRIGLGNFGNYKALEDGLYEVKVDYGPGYHFMWWRYVCAQTWVISEEDLVNNQEMLRLLTLKGFPKREATKPMLVNEFDDSVPLVEYHCKRGP